MQKLPKRLVFNILNKYTLPISPYVSGVQYNLTSALNTNRDYSKDCKKGGKKDGPVKQKLLKYPVHPLEDVMKKFVKSVEPFLKPSEVKQAAGETEVFLKCDAPKLQQLLECAGLMEENWLAHRWLRVAYLQYRSPLPIFSSPGMSLPRQVFDCDDDMLAYASKIIYCLVQYKQLVDQGKIPIQKMGKNELDNSQFGKVLGTCRIPCHPEDKLEYNPNSKHVVVLIKNHFYKLPVYANNKPLSQTAICQELKRIFCIELTDGIPFGILTTDTRNNWADAYADLMAVPENDCALKEIQSSLITVSLDGEVCHDPCGNLNTILAEYLIHGCGSKQHGGNRWMDKTIQLLISKNGYQGFSYEHSPAEGQPIAMMVDYIIKNMNDEKYLKGGHPKVTEPAQKLKLYSSPAVDKHIKTAQQNLDKLASDLHMNVLHFKEYGKGFLKKQKLSPDSFIQMALQYAFYKRHKSPGACYESAHLRIFTGGRTETIRSCSTESMAFAKAMYEPNTDELRVDLLRKAVNTHREYTTMALEGRAIDRHLLGLKLMAMENNLPIPEFYNQPSFKRSTHFRLSTSQVASANPVFMCYGTAFYDGYACCYNPRENDMYLAIASWRGNQETCADLFADALKESLNEMMKALCRAGEKPKNKL